MTLALDRDVDHAVRPLATDATAGGHRTSRTTTAVTAVVAPAVDIDELVRTHLPLVGHLVREVVNRVPAHVNRDELVSAGMYALAVSARNFDPTLGTSFAGFAAIRIRGALTDELRSMDWASRAVRGKARDLDATRAQLTQTLGRAPQSGELAHAMGVSLAELSAVESDVARASVLSLQAVSPEQGAEILPSVADGPESLLLRRETLGFLRDAVEELPERLRLVVEQYFFAQRRMADIAAELGVTESRVSQLRSEALVLLREGMRAADTVESVVDDAPSTATRGRAATTQAYRAGVASRSTLNQRLGATTLLGERHTSWTTTVTTLA